MVRRLFQGEAGREGEEMKPRQFYRRRVERRSDLREVWDHGCGDVYVLPNLGSLTILVPPDESDAFEYVLNFDESTEEFWI